MFPTLVVSGMVMSMQATSERQRARRQPHNATLAIAALKASLNVNAAHFVQSLTTADLDASIHNAVALTRTLQTTLNCNTSGQSAHRSKTTMMYIGSDVDIYPLSYLLCRESRVIFVDPMIWWRNHEALGAWHRAHPGDEADKGFAFPDWKGDDGFYECPPSCDPRPLQSSDVDRIATLLTEGLSMRRCHHTPPPPAEAGAMAPAMAAGYFDWVQALLGASALSDAVVDRASLRVAQMPQGDPQAPLLEFEFVSQGVPRSFAFYAVAAEALNYTRALHGHGPVSTLVNAGTHASHTQHALAELCAAGRLAPSLRVLSTEIEVPSRERGAHKNGRRALHGGGGGGGGSSSSTRALACSSAMRGRRMSRSSMRRKQREDEEAMAGMTDQWSTHQGSTPRSELIGCGCAYAKRSTRCYGVSWQHTSPRG